MKSTVIFIILSCIYGVTVGQTITATLTPQGYNASLGSTVIFSCTVTGTNQIIFSADGSINAAEQQNRNINVLEDLTQPDGSVIGRLQVLATAQNDGVPIFCRAFSDTGDQIETSETVTLQVQGLLSAPTGLLITEETGMNRLSWEAPFTLDLTFIEPDISHYIVCSSIMNEVSCSNVLETEYVFVNLRIDVEFSVSAVNLVGEGNSSNISHTACDSSTATSSLSSDEVTTTVSNGPTLAISFPPDEQSTTTNCYNLYSVQAIPANQGSNVSTGLLLPVVSEGNIELSVVSGLAANTVYNASITTVNTNGESMFTGLLQFSTYDVQAIESSTGAGTIAITCQFASGSQATSCQVTVCAVTDGVVSSDCPVLTVPKPPTSDVSTQQLVGQAVGVYAITQVAATFSGGSPNVVYSEGDLGILGLEQIEVTTPPPPTTQPAPTDFTIDPSVGLIPGGSVAVIAGSVVGAVIVVALVLILIVATVIYLGIRPSNKPRKQDSAGLTTTEMWLEETDGGHNGQAKRLTQSGDSPPLANSLGPMSDMAVIQGTNGAHLEIDLTDSNLPEELQLDSVELTDTTDNVDNIHMYTVNSQPPEYESLAQVQPDILKHSNRGSEIIFHSQPDTTNLDRLTPDDVHEVKLATSMNSLSRRAGPAGGHSRSLSHDLMGTQSVESITSQGQYAEIEHRSGKKRARKPKDNDLVMYSEINVNELTPAVPQKKRSRSALASSDSLRSSDPIETYNV